MPENKSNAAAAGLVGLTVAGGALLGAACYAAYEYFNQPRQQQQQPPPRQQQSPPPPSQQQSPPQVELNRSEGPVNRCPFCGEEIVAGGSIELLCEHSFHKTCLLANYILHMGEQEGYRCRICSEPVPEFILNGLAD